MQPYLFLYMYCPLLNSSGLNISPKGKSIVINQYVHVFQYDFKATSDCELDNRIPIYNAFIYIFNNKI